ncbi:hypothetical protein EON65_48700 [archaeon]|nr:MAG: hypothetical protein EON65_48700 [archaeon]
MQITSPRHPQKHSSPRSQQLKNRLSFAALAFSTQPNPPVVVVNNPNPSDSPGNKTETGVLDVLSSRTLVGLQKIEAAAAYVHMKFPSPPPALPGNSKGSGSMRKKQHISPSISDKQHTHGKDSDDDYTDTMSDMDHSEKDLSEGSDDDDRMQLIKIHRLGASTPITPHAMFPPTLNPPPPAPSRPSTTFPATIDVNNTTPSKLAGLIPNHYYRHLLPRVVDIHAELPDVKKKTGDSAVERGRDEGGESKKLVLKVYLPNNVIKISEL